MKTILNGSGMWFFKRESWFHSPYIEMMDLSYLWMLHCYHFYHIILIMPQTFVILSAQTHQVSTHVVSRHLHLTQYKMLFKIATTEIYSLAKSYICTYIQYYAVHIYLICTIYFSMYLQIINITSRVVASDWSVRPVCPGDHRPQPNQAWPVSHFGVPVSGHVTPFPSGCWTDQCGLWGEWAHNFHV